MIYIKIVDLFNKFGQPDYKGLDTSQFVSGSQVYGDTYGVFATNENITTPPTNVTIIEVTDYNVEKATIQNVQKSSNPIIELQAQNAQVIMALVQGGLM